MSPKAAGRRALCPRALADEWSSKAEHLRELGADSQAQTMEWCARELVNAWDAWQNEELGPAAAAKECGYTSDHLRRLIRDGKLRNVGTHSAVCVRRRDLPRKPHASVSTYTGPLSLREQIARSIVSSEDGGHDD